MPPQVETQHDQLSKPMSPATVMVVLGTRPEAVKLAPIIHALRRTDGLRPIVVVTGQHRHILDEVLSLFEIVPTHDLALQRERQTLTHVTTATLLGLEPLIALHRPAAVLVQGDTTTTLAASLAAFYARVPVVHVEAGLRTGNRWSPYPEETNRRLTTRLTELHLAPTSTARQNLINDGVDSSSVIVTGNSVIDALRWVVRRLDHGDEKRKSSDGAKLVLVTAHRRESWDGGLAEIAHALRQVVDGRSDVRVLLPIHPNPVVRKAMAPILDSLPNVNVVEPLGYRDFVAAMVASHVILSDSGGVQEEASSLGVPVLVARENTERPEAIEAGVARLVGNQRAEIVKQLRLLLDDPAEPASMRQSINLYGDGQAGERTIDALRHLLWGEPRPADFSPEVRCSSRSDRAYLSV
jgi:UDP-N-acetylglucosamine 2-epimerase (non-hydrolysing)